ILIPVAQSLGYTILPKSGVEAFPQQRDLSVFALGNRKHQDLWLISQKGRSEFARIDAISELLKKAALELE
ncbi:MAG: LysR family transcriptional regulator, partial [Pseudophaeobacter sp.]